MTGKVKPYDLFEPEVEDEILHMDNTVEKQISSDYMNVTHTGKSMTLDEYIRKNNLQSIM